VAAFVQHQETCVKFTVVQKLHQCAAAKRGVIGWRAPFFLRPRRKTEFFEEPRQMPGSSTKKKKSPRQAIETCEATIVGIKNQSIFSRKNQN